MLKEAVHDVRSACTAVCLAYLNDGLAPPHVALRAILIAAAAAILHMLKRTSLHSLLLQLQLPPLGSCL